MSYQIEVDTEARIVRILTEEDGILENTDAMQAVRRAVKKAFGPNAVAQDEGCDCTNQSGQSIGWEWDVH
jgi:hypothetical protein